jgi:putative membrane protein
VSPATVGLILALVAIAVAASRGMPWLLIAMLPAVIGFATYWVRSIVRSLRYSIAPTPDGVRITFGLLTTITEIVPPGRVHAVEISQSILWRPAGWWTVRITRITGKSLSDTSNDQFTTVLPVGTIADVQRVLELLLPQVTPDGSRLIVDQGVLGPQPDDSFVDTPRRAWFLHPLSWRRNGYRLTPDVLLLRRGWIWRKLSILPLARLQSIAVHQGPLDRVLRVASAQAHTVTGPVSTELGAIDRDAALDLFAGVAAGAVAASSRDRSHRWGEGADADTPEDARADAAGADGGEHDALAPDSGRLA